MSNNKYR